MSDADRIPHMDSASDVDCGKAWRAVQRPSDMVHEFIDLYYFRDTYHGYTERVFETSQRISGAREIWKGTWKGTWKGVCQR